MTTSLRIITLSLAATGLAQAGQDLLPAAAPSRSHFRISAGYSYRSLGDVKFTTGNYSGGVRLPFLASIPHYGGNSAGSADEYADRRYNDGFVSTDAGTAATGDTWNWGYASANQVQRNESLYFHTSGGAEVSSSSSRSNNAGSTWGEDISGAAPVLQFDWLYDLKPDMSVGLSLGWMFLSADGSQSTSNFTANQAASAKGFAITDRYALQGIIVPTAPYAGSYNGPGPVITNKPTERFVSSTGVLAASSVDFANEIVESFEVDLHTISLGPTLEKRWDRLSVVVGAGLAINVANYDAEFQETLYANNKAIRRWQAKESGTELLLGAYIQTNVQWQLSQRWSLGAFARYDWSEDFSTKVGPSTFQFDPSGVSVGATLGFAF